MSFRRRIIPSFIFLLVSIFLAMNIKSIAFARPNTEEEFPAELEEYLSGGAKDIYHLRFEQAQFQFEQAIQMLPDHPAPYFFLTMLYWYELTYDSLLYRNPELEKRFVSQAELTAKIAKLFAKKEETKSVGLLYWGGALGAKGWYQVTRRQWIRAYFSGKKGFAHVKKVVDLNPEMYDAYLGLGMYEYYAATLGPVLKTLASFSIRGDRERGLELLALAQFKSRYVRQEAAYFLWNVAIEEERLEDALARAQDLARQFPQSPFFRWCEIQTLFYQKKWVQVIRKGEQFKSESLKKLPEGQTNTFPLLLSKTMYHCGAASFMLGHLDQARTYFESCVEDKTPFAGWKAMALLRLGELKDLKEDRAQAQRFYREVLNLPEFWNSRDLAKRRLKEPFSRQESISDIMTSPLQTWRTDLD